MVLIHFCNTDIGELHLEDGQITNVAVAEADFGQS